MDSEIILFLRAQTTLCRQMIACCQERQQELLAGNADAVTAGMRRQEELFGKFTQLEDKKQEKLQNFDGIWPPEETALIEAEKQKLRQQMKALRELGSQNQRLLAYALQLLEIDINLLTQVPADTGYAPPGKSGLAADKKKMFDASV